MEVYKCPICHKHAISVIAYVCTDCGTKFTEDTFKKYLAPKEPKVPQTTIKKPPVTPEMRKIHFDATGMYTEDLLILKWFKEHYDKT